MHSTTGSAELGLDEPTAQLWHTSCILTAAPGSAAHGRHVAGCSEFHFYKGSFEKEREKCIRITTQQPHLKRHRKQLWTLIQSRAFWSNSRAIFYSYNIDIQKFWAHKAQLSLETFRSELLNLREVKRLLSYPLTGTSGSPDLRRIFSQYALSDYCSAACWEQETKI